MSNQIFNEVGILPPFASAAASWGGTIVMVTGAAAAYSQGHIVRLLPTGHTGVTYATLDGEAAEEYTCVLPTAVDATEVTMMEQSRIHGVLLQDLAIAGTGYALVRGLALAIVDTTSTSITLDHGMFTGDGAAATLNTLSHVADAVTGDYIRCVAKSRYAGTIASATAIGLFPVLFNGVEGFADYVAV